MEIPRLCGASLFAAVACFFQIAVAPSAEGKLEALLFEGRTGHTIRLRETSRGIFLGLCGFATERIRWESVLEVGVPSRGVYTVGRSANIEDGGKTVKNRTGSMSLDSKRILTVNLRIAAGGESQPWVRNGKYQIDRS